MSVKARRVARAGWQQFPSRDSEIVEEQRVPASPSTVVQVHCQAEALIV